MPTVPISHPLALERLRDALRGSGGIDVLAAAIAIATHVHPLVQPRKILDALDRFAADVRHIAGKDNPPLQALRHVLFLRHGFFGNAANYSDPANSYIDAVLERRTGLPILLALVYVETARRSGYTAHGIALPGHFLAALDMDGDAANRIYVDAFNRGAVLTAQQCRAAMHNAGGPWREEYLAPADPRQWALRLLNNLRSTYLEMGDTANTAAVLEQMLILEPDNLQAGQDLKAAYQILDGRIARNN